MRFYADKYERGDDGVWTIPNWEESAQRYSEHLQKIRPHLPASVQELIKYMELHSFHDWSIGKWGRDRQAGTAFLEFYYPCGRLEFAGVQSIEMPQRDDISGWPWIVEEFDLNDDGTFVLRVFVEDGEIHVVAKEVRMSGLPIYDD
jgi:hypothetical protein